MSLRHLARQVVVQALFTWDFYEQDNDRRDEFFGWNIARHKGTLVDTGFPRDCYNGVIKKVDVLDEIITKAAPQWPINRIAPVDRNILRLGIYEMLFAHNSDVPPRVAINEAIELGKVFGSANTYKFISGVLGSIYEASDLKKKDTYKKTKDNPADYPVVEKIGAVVYAHTPEQVVELAMVHDIFGKWTLSKGGSEEGETAEEACKRSVKKELGLEVEVGQELDTTEYVARHPELGKIKKRVRYFLCKASFEPLTLEEENDGLTKASWISLEQLDELETYDDIKPLVARAMKIISR